MKNIAFENISEANENDRNSSYFITFISNSKESYGEK